MPVGSQFGRGKLCWGAHTKRTESIGMYRPPVCVFPQKLRTLALSAGACPMRLTGPGWDLAVQRLKTGKCGDELALTVELLKHAPEKFRQCFSYW